MSIALFSTAYLPPVAYVAALARREAVLMEMKETFPKQTYRNRALIMTAEGVRALTVPVVRRNHSRTEEVTIDYRTRWNVVHLRTLTAAYAASPFFLYYRDGLERALLRHYERLADLNESLLDWMLGALKISCRRIPTDDYSPVAADDYRNRYSPKVALPADAFPPYYQVFADRQPFAPNLSAVDLLMNMGPEARDYLKDIAI